MSAMTLLLETETVETVETVETEAVETETGRSNALTGPQGPRHRRKIGAKKQYNRRPAGGSTGKGASRQPPLSPLRSSPRVSPVNRRPFRIRPARGVGAPEGRAAVPACARAPAPGASARCARGRPRGARPGPPFREIP